MKQADFAADFSDFMDRDRTYSLLSISSWESGSKLPPLLVAINIAKYFKVSLDWLMGLKDEEDGETTAPKKTKKETIHAIEANLIIKEKQLKSFDKQPIYVVFNNIDLPNKWGILDYSKKRIIFSDAIMQLDNGLSCTFYANIPEAEKSPTYNIRKPLSMSQILKKQPDERIWVEMRSMNALVKAKYNGWYKVNTKTKCIEGHMATMPLDSLSISYDAYSSEG